MTKEEKKKTKDEIAKLKVKVADLFIQREKLSSGLQQTNQQLQINLNELQKLEEKLKEQKNAGDTKDKP